MKNELESFGENKSKNFGENESKSFDENESKSFGENEYGPILSFLMKENAAINQTNLMEKKTNSTMKQSNSENEKNNLRNESFKDKALSKKIANSPSWYDSNYELNSDPKYDKYDFSALNDVLHILSKKKEFYYSKEFSFGKSKKSKEKSIENGDDVFKNTNIISTISNDEVDDVYHDAQSGGEVLSAGENTE